MINCFQGLATTPFGAVLVTITYMGEAETTCFMADAVMMFWKAAMARIS